MGIIQQRLLKKEVNYSFGAYNKFDEKEQWIRITEGCPHDCPYCNEPTKIKFFGIPEIVRKDVKIMDMNLLCKKEALEIIRKLGEVRVDGKVVEYELVCGIDYRFLTQEIADVLHKSRFRKIRLAWDWGYEQQFLIKKAIEKLIKAGYSSKTLMIFMICNWKVHYSELLLKLDLCKIWRVQVADCWFDGQDLSKQLEIIPLHWASEQCKDFRHRVRKHNQLVNFGVDPELKLMGVG